MARTPKIPKAFLTPKSPAQKAFVAAEKATKRADNFRDQNAGWRFAGKPHSQETLDKLDADLKSLKQEAKDKQRTYQDLTGQTRQDRRDPNRPKTGADYGKTGLRRRTEDRTPPVPAEPKPEAVDRGPFSQEFLDKFNANAEPKGFKSQKERSKQGELDKLELRGAIDRHPVEKPRHPDAAHAEAEHQSMGDQAARARARAPQDRKNKSAADTAQFAKDTAPKIPSFMDTTNGLKTDSKPGAGDRRSNSQSGLHKLAISQGWTEKRTKNGWMLKSPDGKHAVSYHLSPSDTHAFGNLRAEFEKAGLKIPGRRSGDIKVDSRAGRKEAKQQEKQRQIDEFQRQTDVDFFRLGRGRSRIAAPADPHAFVDSHYDWENGVEHVFPKPDVPARRKGDRRTSDIKVDTSKGDTSPRGPIPRLPRTGPGTNDQFTGGPSPIPPNPNKGPGGWIVAVHPGPSGDVFGPKPPLPPTGPGTNDQDTLDRTGLNKPGSGTIIAKSGDKSGDKGTPSGDNRFNHGFPKRDPSLPKVNVEGPLKNVPHKPTTSSGTTFQKPVEPYVKPVFQPKPPPANQDLRLAVIKAQKAQETAKHIERGSKPSPQPPNQPRVERDPNAEPVRTINWATTLRRK